MTNFPSERKMFKDALTGVDIIQLTNFPTVHLKFYFHFNQFTPDSKTLLFFAYRSASRDAPIDVFKVNTDGHGLCRILDGENTTGHFLSYSGKTLYYIRGKQFCSTDIVTGESKVLAEIPGINGSGCGSLSYDDSTYVADVLLTDQELGTTSRLDESYRKDAARAILRISTDGKKYELHKLPPQHYVTHTQIEPSEGKLIAFQYSAPGSKTNLWLINADGSNLREFPLNYGNGHWMWIGGNKKTIMTNNSEHKTLERMSADTKYHDIIAGGPHFWHAASSLDGKWAISDTNWPDIGLQLINLETKKLRTLCFAQSSNSHPQWTHPHPSFSPDNKYVVFNSDRTGVTQIYLARIPDEWFAELSM